MSDKTITENLQNLGLKAALEYLDANPDENALKLLDWLQMFDIDGNFQEQAAVVREALQDRNGNWRQFVRDLYSNIDEGVRKQLFENFIINAGIISSQRLKVMRKKYDCNIPWAILLDPTSSCNLQCKGCWAAEYGKKLNLSLEEWDKVIEQAKQMGVFMFLYSGGEPLVRKQDILKICEKHKDCVFLAFTNGTLIDEKFADDMLRVKNFVPAISVEGYEKETDFRRGKGTYDAVIKAMEILRKRKLPFGISCCYTSKNTASIGSEKFIDDMINRGAKFAWFFTYIPVGVHAVPQLIATAQQREFMYHQVRKFRKTKPFFLLDFWNDAEYIDGCVAGGRRYLHINANGDIEPCAFIHYSDSNIREKTLLEACQSPLFKAYHDNQPFNENHLRPCPLLDNPDQLKDMVHSTKAKSTDLLNPERVDSLCNKCVHASRKWAIAADRLWREH